MSNFYTNVQVRGSKILYRGVEDGRRVKRRVDYSPTLFLPSKKPTQFTTIHNEYVEPIQPGNISECRQFIKDYENVGNFRIFGNTRYEYAFISDTFPDAIEWTAHKQHIKVCNIDIEVGSDNGFPSPDTATEPITAITIKMDSKYLVWGCGVFINNRADVDYIKCANEVDLIKNFLSYWTRNYPDIITGWNVNFFDVPYLINRVAKLLGDDVAKTFSPWNDYSDRTVKMMGREQKAYKISGIAILDYIELYRKFSPHGMSQESYKLNYICHVEINEKKLSYEEYGNLHRLYIENYQLFIEYNIRDVELIEKLDNKLKLIELALTLAYDSKCNYDDVFTQVRMWDTLIYNRLKRNNKVIPPSTHMRKDELPGGYVKEPIPGLYNWVASFDLDSLYPHLIMQFNISPDTHVDPSEYTDDMREFMASNNIDVPSLLHKKIDTQKLKDMGVTLTPNGQFFRVTEKGFLAEMMQEMYDDRKLYKKKALSAKQELENETDSSKKEEIENRIARFNNLQLAKKVCLNSAYGALGNEFFRFFDVRQAGAITTSGQLAIQWIGEKLNGYLNKILKTTDKDYIIASDTDSVYITFEELVNKSFDNMTDKNKVIAFLDKVCETKIQPFIDKSYDELANYLNSFEQKMHMKREVLADRGVWTAKKRYFLNVYNSEGVQYAKPKVKISGLEMIKSSTPSACREKLKESLDVILEGTQEDMYKFIADFREEFKTLPTSDIAFPKGVNGIIEYSDPYNPGMYKKGTPIHVRGCIIYNYLLHKHKLGKKYQILKEGDKIKYIYLKEPNVIRSNIISFSEFIPSEFALDSVIDYSLQFEKSFLEPLKVILDCIGWKPEKTASIMDFFS